MRHIYLLRHGRPQFPMNKECSISRTDYPLSLEGILQAKKLGDYFSDINISAVYCSTLSRSVQTAVNIASDALPLFPQYQLRETDCGIWEGLTKNEIKERFPAEYEMRGIDPTSVVPNGGESLKDGLLRMQAAFKNIISASTGNIIIVAHATVNRLLLCSMMNKDISELYSIPQPYGCVNEIIYEAGRLYVGRIGFMPEDYPDEEAILSIWERYGTPESVIRHCRAVAEKALCITKELALSGYELNQRLILASALLHDVARTKPNHAVIGAEWLNREGYGKVAAIIAAHHYLDENENDPVSEKTVVFLADKFVSGEREVTLEERYEESSLKCKTEEEKAFHDIKYIQALSAQLRIFSLIGVNCSRE